MYLARDILPFVMYCVNGKPRSSLLIESTDSMVCVIWSRDVGRVLKYGTCYFWWEHVGHVIVTSCHMTCSVFSI